MGTFFRQHKVPHNSHFCLSDSVNFRITKDFFLFDQNITRFRIKNTTTLPVIVK